MVGVQTWTHQRKPLFKNDFLLERLLHWSAQAFLVIGNDSFMEEFVRMTCFYTTRVMLFYIHSQKMYYIGLRGVECHWGDL